MKKRYIKKTGAVLIILACAAILLFGVAPYTIAWLTDNASVTNVFDKGEVTIGIKENFNEQVKSNVTIKNTSNIPVYIRAVLVPVWRDGNLNSGLPTAGTYTITPGSGWVLSGDGYYYHNGAVNPGDSTGVLIASCSPKTDIDPVYNGMKFEMQVIASAIQSEGWPADVDTAAEAFAAAAAGS
jgi:hypothetical protein